MRLMRGRIIEFRSFAAIAALDALAVNTSTYALCAASSKQQFYSSYFYSDSSDSDSDSDRAMTISDF